MGLVRQHREVGFVHKKTDQSDRVRLGHTVHKQDLPRPIPQCLILAYMRGRINPGIGKFLPLTLSVLEKIQFGRPIGFQLLTMGVRRKFGTYHKAVTVTD